ncbi:hypothetical protein RT717_03835 [Imperialibacter roseus]|uniref:Uncharacterized protein n=1 Tax=Imperialibacter roseus TaxID=1324217 RepID=A0ABZ0IUD0_9BACT|nr:hypothetical protein [Imperialibacter roseus]WOK07754.1 hypothetical protein RT717_03835 [Imperialibacter roseus]
MHYKTDKSIPAFLQHLETVTTAGSASLVVGPFLLLHYLLNGSNRRDFYGHIYNTGFDIAIIKGLSPSFYTLNGQLSETDQGVVVEVRYDLLIFPVLIFTLISIALTLGSVFMFWKFNNWEDGFFLSGMLLLTVAMGGLGARNDRQRLRRHFVALTGVTEIVK